MDQQAAVYQSVANLSTAMKQYTGDFSVVFPSFERLCKDLEGFYSRGEGSDESLGTDALENIFHRLDAMKVLKKFDTKK